MLLKVTRTSQILLIKQHWLQWLIQELDLVLPNTKYSETNSMPLAETYGTVQQVEVISAGLQFGVKLLLEQTLAAITTLI